MKRSGKKVGQMRKEQRGWKELRKVEIGWGDEEKRKEEGWKMMWGKEEVRA